MYQQTSLADHSAIGAPGDLPAVIATWGDALDLLSDLTGKAPKEFGFDGTGFWPVVVSPATFDPAKQALADGIAGLTVDASGKRWIATQAVRDLTAAELTEALGAAQAAKVAELTLACSAQIVGGYSSSALGSPHTYPAKTTDQINMMGSVTASLLPGLPAGWTTPFWVADEDATWSFQNHTAAQIQQAGADGKTSVATAQLKLATLTAEVAAAKTQADVAAIAW